MAGKLNASHRCDACPSRAYAAAEVAGVDLHFCGHHFTKHEAALRLVVDEDAILDERHLLAEEVKR